MKFLGGFLAAFLLCTSSSFAQMPGGTSKQPVEIEASQQLEWIRDKNMYRATGDVVITQGDTIIKSDTAEAQYDPATGPSALTIFTVTGNVVMTSKDQKITAENAVYDTRSQILTLQGDIIVLTTPTMVVTSRNSMEYNAAEHKATAKGNAEVKEATRILKADTIIAWTDAETNKLQRATATGNVIITNKGKDGTDVAQSRKADYNAVNNTIDLTGDVKLTRGSNHMQGDHATVNLTTGVSSLKNNSTQTGRVRAIFTPGDDATPLPSVTGKVPMVNSKKEYEQPYAVGK